MSNWQPPRSRRSLHAVGSVLVALLVTIVAMSMSAGAASAGTSLADAPVAGSSDAAPLASGVEHEALTVAANPTVGPLFTAGLSSGHTCTASVLSVGQGLLLTAAHCLSGNVQGIQFVPGYDGTKADPEPYGVWTVTRAWVPAGWAVGQDPQHDFAILQVADNVVDGQSTAVNDVVGGNAIGIALGDGSVAVTVPAYVSGAHDAPISCTAALQVDQGFQSFGCAGYLNGTSGAPWIEASDSTATPAVVGVIGGLHQGGCTDSTSYSSDFDSDVFLLVVRAVVGLPSDTAPVPQGDGC